MLLEAFAPPGNLDDFDESQRAAWSRFISDSMEQSIRGNPDQVVNDSPRAQFYNPTRTETADDAQTKDITWTAFPRLVRVSSIADRQRWRRADSARALQDEYCEWSVDRDDEGKITKVTFTCESPEYWSFLAGSNRAKVVALYREFVSPDVREEDLFDSRGNYNRLNRWNSTTTDGAMHLVQVNNTLTAEIEIAAAATIVREIDGRVLTGEQELIACGRYGAAGRNSDPHIGGEVNDLARQKADITLAEPVGLYFGGLSTAGWETPDGEDPQAFWKYLRGDADHPVRAVFEVPAERGYSVGDIMIDGRPIEFGGQIADFITIKLTGLACRIGASTVEPMTGCVQPISQPGGLVEVADAVAASLTQPTRSFR